MTWLIYPIGMLLVVVVGLAVWRLLDHRADRVAWKRLTAGQTGETKIFDGSMTAGLPEPAQRYFNFTIATGTPLYTALEIDMTGEIGLDDLVAPSVTHADHIDGQRPGDTRFDEADELGAYAELQLGALVRQLEQAIDIALDAVEVDNEPRDTTARFLQQRAQFLKVSTTIGHQRNLRSRLNFLSVYGA